MRSGSTIFKPGIVLRDTSAGSGLLMVEGRQVPFRLEGIWRSPVAPKPDMPVQVEFDEQGQLLSIEVTSRGGWRRWLSGLINGSGRRFYE